ncbi:MAG: Fe-S protein assembly co-chaperone HscB [Candidatus Kapaibacterium sp.]|jgi:Fe-S protein assembly co-chaperone HscB
MIDHFKVFGIPRSLGLGRDSLESRFHDLQRETHPDKFAEADHLQLEEAQEASAEVNQAYRVLRDPLARLKHLLLLYGYSVGASKQIPQSLLFSVMDAQEKIAEMEFSKDAKQKVRIAGDLDTTAKGFELRLETLQKERLELSARWDGSVAHSESAEALSATEKTILEKFVELLVEQSYIETLLATVRAAQKGESAVIRH